jgi:hypothetical protein
MADNLQERAPQDTSRISFEEDCGMCYRTIPLGVSKERLTELVGRHARSAAAVRAASGK